jgi:hypothetical protein
VNRYDGPVTLREVDGEADGCLTVIVFAACVVLALLVWVVA